MIHLSSYLLGTGNRTGIHGHYHTKDSVVSFPVYYVPNRVLTESTSAYCRIYK